MVHALSIPDFAFLDQFCRKAELLLKIIIKKVEIAVGSTGPEWALINNLVVHCGHLFLLTSATAWPQVLEHAHGMGHEGIQKTL
jgi:hypothetical protein